jgi:hypothetical protein
MMARYWNRIKSELKEKRILIGIAWMEYKFPRMKEIYLCLRYFPNIVIGGPLFNDIWKTKICAKWQQPGEMQKRNSELEWNWEVVPAIDSGDKDWYYLDRKWSSQDIDKGLLSQKELWDISMIDVSSFKSANRLIFDVNVFFSKKRSFNGEFLKIVTAFLLFIVGSLVVMDMEPMLPKGLFEYWSATMTWLNTWIDIRTVVWVLVGYSILNVFANPLYVIRSILKIDAILADELRLIELQCFDKIPALQDVKNKKEADQLKELAGISANTQGSRGIVAL